MVDTQADSLSFRVKKVKYESPGRVRFPAERHSAGVLKKFIVSDDLNYDVGVVPGEFRPDCSAGIVERGDGTLRSNATIWRGAQ